MPRVLVSSNPWPLEATTGLLSNLRNTVNEHPDVSARKRFPESIYERAADSMFLGAAPRPVSLDNFNPDHSEYIVGVNHYGRRCSCENLADDFEQACLRILNWNRQGIFRNCSLILHDASTPRAALYVENSKDQDEWEFKWHLYNKARDESLNLSQRLEFADAILRSIGTPFGDTSSRFRTEDDFLVFEETDDSRFRSCPGFTLDDPREVLGLVLKFDPSEVDLIVEGYRNLILEFQISARVQLRMGHELDMYRRWATECSHPTGHYEYNYEGELIQSVVDFFNGRSVDPPSGFVPYAEYQLGAKGARFITLSLDFGNEGVRFFASGNGRVSFDDITEFLDATGLNEYVDDSCVISR